MKLRWKYILGCAVLFESGIVYSTCDSWWKLLFIPIYFLGGYLVDAPNHSPRPKAASIEEIEALMRSLRNRKPMDTPL